MLEFALAAALAGAPDVVVTFDNGEFNAPLYAARWAGWRQPSAAQELASRVARAAGRNPRVFTYMPAGRTAGLPGEAHEVPATRAGCPPGEACECPVGDACWGALAANYHPSGSSSLARSASAARARVRREGAPRWEIHFTDFFEEDPSPAEDPADSDRCVTADGVRRAAASLLRVGDGERVDHAAVGVLRLTLSPPPPGGSWGTTYRFVPSDGACWSGEPGRAWVHGAAPLDFALGAVVLGVNTGDDPRGAQQFLDALLEQLDGDGVSASVVPVAAPPAVWSMDGVVGAADADPWRVGSGMGAAVPCDGVVAEAALSTPVGRLVVADAQGRCDGQMGVTFAAGELERHFVRHAGFDPRVRTLPIRGQVRLAADPAPVTAALNAIDAGGERGLPLWPSAVAAFSPDRDAGALGPWRAEFDVQRLEVVGLDRRPWMAAILASTMLGLGVGLAVAAGVKQLHAARAMRERYQAAAGAGDAPLSVILAEAHRDVASRRGWRTVLGSAAALSVAGLAFWLVMGAYRVLRG